MEAVNTGGFHGVSEGSFRSRGCSFSLVSGSFRCLDFGEGKGVGTGEGEGERESAGVRGCSFSLRSIF